MRSSPIQKWISFITLFGIAASHSGCGGTTTGNGLVDIRVGPYNELTLLGRLLPSAFATVSSVTFCFKRVRFKLKDANTSDPENDSDNQDFSVGAITVSPGGTTLGSITLPEGTYRRVEFDLENNCGSGTSVQLSNSNPGGPFSTNSRVTIKFEGTFVVDQASESLQLGIQAMINALDTVTASGNQVKNQLESVSGTL